MELSQVLEKTFSSDSKDQQYALTLLQQAMTGNFPEYVKQLATILANVDSSHYIRRAAGLQLKNVLASREQSFFDKNKLRWLSVPLEVRQYVKECVLKTLGTEVRPSSAAQCVAAISCIEFPIRQWPELIDRLNANVTTKSDNPLLKESSLEALGYICQDLTDKQKVAPVLAAIVYALKTEETSVFVSLAATKALSEIVEWVVTRTLEEHVDAIVDVLCAYLQTAEMNLYEEAAKCLYKIASRKCAKSIETPIVVSLFRDAPMQRILTAANLAAADSSTSCEHYKYLKALLDLLCALGIHLSEVWTYVMKPPPNFSLYISALSAFFVHPSIYIRAETAQVIATFCSNEKISTNEDFLKYIPQLLKVLPRTMSKTCSPTIGQEDLTFQYSRMDYENKEDLQREYLRIREYCLRIIRETMPNHFDKLFDVVNDWVVNRCVVQPQEVTSDEWELMKRFLTAVISGSYQNELLTTLEVRKKYLQLFDVIFNCCLNILNSSGTTAPTTLPNFMNGLLSTLSSFFQIFENFGERILNVLDLLKLILLINNENNLNVEITATKRHCIALLLKIVSVFPEQVKPYARNVFDLVGQVSNNVSMMQRSNLVHVLASLSNLASTVEEKTLFLRNAILYDINYIETEPFSASMENFLNNTGLSFAPDLKAIASQSCPYYLSRLNLKASLTALEGVLNQVEVPNNESSSANIFNLFFTVLPKIFQFCRCLTSIYMPEYSSKVHPIYGLSILEMVPSERQTLVSSITLEQDSNGADSKKFEEFEVGQFSNGYGNQEIAMFMRKFIVEISDLIQSILGLFFFKFPLNIYSINNSTELITGTLYAIENVPNFRLRFWLRRAWSRIITSCPEQYSNTIIPLVTRLSFHLQKRLVEQWLLIKQTQTTDEYEPTEEELIAESTMSLLTRECSYFIVHFILGETFSLKSARRDIPLPITLISRKLMENENVRLAIIGLLARLITCPDSQAVVKCMPAVTVIVHEYFSTFDEQTSIELLVHSIKSLQMFSNDELATGPLLVLIYDIYSYLRPKYPSLLEVIKQVPTCLPENISTFDTRIMSMLQPEDAKNFDKIKKDLVRKALTSTKSRLHYRKASSETNGGDEELKEME
uniref:Importin N-terminal domain-containing protein n=1 Tax=Meloidogyne enterolobii TaxID=390850 RepID=A0A6V7TY22_MELEN|nr:unnamed protein product [Meloidogyne enterolobii]